MRLMLTGGGTGGHLYPGLAIAEEMERRVTCQIIFVGTKHGVEAKVVPDKGYRFRKVWISGFHRRRMWRNALFPLKVAVSFVQALFIVLSFQPDVIVGTGGYVSWPVLAAGLLTRKKIVLQEQNYKPGVVTRLMAPYAKSVHLSFENSKTFFWRISNLRVSGNPTRKELDVPCRDGDYAYFGLDAGKTTLFVLGGSQGARAVNEAVIKLMGGLMKREDVQILWAAGPRWSERVKKETEVYGNRVHVFPYIEEMGMAYCVSDIVICRAGATTVAELTRIGLPAVFIPLPGAAGGHQAENARVLKEAGAAEIVLEQEMDGGKLLEAVSRLLDDSEIRGAMGRIAKEFGRFDAARLIVDDILLMLKYEAVLSC
ncbi:MAG: undecaprenyldiphospho-muramoylpentapeptide beta-N-acetylglucosaminyltransferase [bacterium]